MIPGGSRNKRKSTVKIFKNLLILLDIIWNNLIEMLLCDIKFVFCDYLINLFYFRFHFKWTVLYKRPLCLSNLIFFWASLLMEIVILVWFNVLDKIVRAILLSFQRFCDYFKYWNTMILDIIQHFILFKRSFFYS